MVKRIAVSSIVTFLMLGAPSIALASGGGWWGGDDKGDKGGDNDHGRAPEPLTMSAASVAETVVPTCVVRIVRKMIAETLMTAKRMMIVTVAT